MSILRIRERLENWQIVIYFCAVGLGIFVGISIPGAVAMEDCISPALALMLFVTFLQVPLTDLWKAFLQIRFLTALLIANFLAIPVLVAIFFHFIPLHPMVRLGMLLVLLTPCIDYVVTFSHLGRSNASLLLAATPILLIVQMLMLPVYLYFFLGKDASHFVHVSSFVHAFVWLIAIPLLLAAMVQLSAVQTRAGACLLAQLGLLPVPATAAVLFIIISGTIPRLKFAVEPVLSVIPIYIVFAMIAPLIGWSIGRLFHLEASAGRAIAFSAATRNSLVILPLALAIPVSFLPAIIVAQTLVELVAELIYIRLLPKL